MLSNTLTATQELTRGETLLWSGTPRQGLFLRPSDAFQIPFSLLWAGFAVFWEAMVLTTPGPGFFALWGIPFVLVGLYITFGRFIVDSWRRRRTTYALTSQRVVIRSGTTTQSLSLAAIGDVTLKEHRNGRGSITFGSSPFPAFIAGSSWPGVKGAPVFDQIASARQVYEQIRNAQHQDLRPVPLNER